MTQESNELTAPPQSVRRVTEQGHLSAPSVLANLVPLQKALRRVLPERGVVLEIGSGTGEHVVSHAHSFPHLAWQPSDTDLERLVSISAWSKDAKLPNLLPVAKLNACKRGWSQDHGPVDVILIANLLHLISEGELAILLDEASLALPQVSHGQLIITGPFLKNGVAPTQADAQFNEALKEIDASLGYKDIEMVHSVLLALGFSVSVESLSDTDLMIHAEKKPNRSHE